MYHANHSPTFVSRQTSHVPHKPLSRICIKADFPCITQTTLSHLYGGGLPMYRTNHSHICREADFPCTTQTTLSHLYGGGLPMYRTNHSHICMEADFPCTTQTTLSHLYGGRLPMYHTNHSPTFVWRQTSHVPHKPLSHICMRLENLFYFISSESLIVKCG